MGRPHWRVALEGLNPTNMITIIIPTYNAEATIVDAVESCLESRCIAKVIVVADNPTDKTVEQLANESYNSDIVEVILLDKNIGAGACRNMGMTKVDTSHVAFLDADDTINAGNFDAVYNNMTSDCDLAVGAYKYCKCKHELKTSTMTPGDERIFRSVLNCQESVTLERRDSAELLMLVNYPWNKLYRTDFIKKNDLSFQSLPVHNDILFHWSCLLHASKVLVHHAVMTNHFVFDNRNQMTNDTSARRLAVFDALQSTRDVVFSVNPNAAPYFYQFLQILLLWTLEKIDRQYISEFVDRLHVILKDYTIAEFNKVYSVQPIVACNMMILKNNSGEITNPNFKL